MLTCQSTGILSCLQAAHRKSCVLRRLFVKYPGQSGATFGCSQQADDEAEEEELLSREQREALDLKLQILLCKPFLSDHLD